MARTAPADDVDLTRDRALVELAQGGDLAAFGELYTRYFRRLVRFSMKRVGDPHEAEEIAQEAFARAYRALPSFAGERRFYPWMTVIASRLCVDALRRRGRVEVGEIAELEFVEPGFDRLDSQGDVEKLRVAMAQLNERHREVLELREHQGWSYQHIADHYEVTIGTVEALLWRARKALRREFTALGSALLVIPGLRSIVARNDGTQASTIAALGSMGTVVALSLGALGAGAPATALPAAAPLLVAASYSTAAHEATPPTAPSLQPGAGVAVASGAARGAPAAAVSSQSPAASAPVPLPRVVTGAQAASVARQQPIVISVGGGGPVIGVNPPIAAPHISVHIGGK